MDSTACQKNRVGDAFRDRVKGVLLGLAAGDKIGGPLQMALLLAESLVHIGTYDSNDYSTRLLTWHAQGSFDTGPVAESVFRKGASGIPLAAAARDVHASFRGMTAGCNPAHRCAPLAIAASVVPATSLAAAAREQAALTHAHPVAGDVAAAFAIALRALVLGDSWDSVLAAMPSAFLPRPGEALNNGGFSPDVLRAALHFVSSCESFSTALDASVRFAGSANYCPVLVGALAGARWGARQIPASSHAHCFRRDLERASLAAELLGGAWTD